MDKKQFMEKLTHTQVADDAVSSVEHIYGPLSAPDVGQLLSMQDDTLFFDDCRLLSHDEILRAQQELHVDFTGRGMLPLIDCGDNDFIVFHLKTGRWSKFNIVDESVFQERTSLKDVLF